MPQPGPAQRPEPDPQGPDPFHPLDGLPRPMRADRRFHNRHRTHSPTPRVTQPALTFARSVGVFLLAASALKVLALATRSPLLDSPHPLLPWLPTWQVIFLAAAIEAFAGLGSLSSRRQCPVLVGPSMCLATLSGYRAVATWLAVESPCACLGPLAHWLRWNPATERAITLWALLGCLVLMTVAWWSHLRGHGGTVHDPLPLPQRPPA